MTLRQLVTTIGAIIYIICGIVAYVTIKEYQSNNIIVPESVAVSISLYIVGSIVGLFALIIWALNAIREKELWKNIIFKRVVVITTAALYLICTYYVIMYPTNTAFSRGVIYPIRFVWTVFTAITLIVFILRWLSYAREHNLWDKKLW